MKMRKSCLLVIGALLLVLGGFATQSEAMGERLSVGVNLPAVRFAAPPDVVVIPGTYVYIVPDVAVDVFFYQDYWWRPHEGHWYRSQDYNGSWRYVEPRRIPSGLRALPQDYRHRLSPRYERIPHREVQRNWKTWEEKKNIGISDMSMTARGKASTTAEDEMNKKAGVNRQRRKAEDIMSTKNGIKWIMDWDLMSECRRESGHKDTCDIKNACPA